MKSQLSKDLRCVKACGSGLGRYYVFQLQFEKQHKLRELLFIHLFRTDVLRDFCPSARPLI